MAKYTSTSQRTQFVLAIALSVIAALHGSFASASSITKAKTLTSDAHTARGVLRAVDMAEIAAGMSGRLTTVNYKAGETFKSGAVLARFDCKRQTAELTALSRAHETRKLQYENAQELLNAGAAGELDTQIAKSEMAQAAAERDSLKAALKMCVVHAPYAGRVISRQAASHETVQAGAPIYSIMKSGAPEISLIIPSNWMRWLEPGTAFDFTVDETGETFNGKVTRLGAAVDPVSQTLEIFAKPTQSTGRALAGMSGMAHFKNPQNKSAP